MIPKIVHYCWLSGDPIPEKLKICMDSWKKKLPDYEFMLWDLKRFDINQTLWTKQAFETKKYAFAADYIRLFAVYNYGGIYMDMDVEVIKSFNDLLHRDYIIGYETTTGIEAGIFGAAPHAEWVKSCLKHYEGKSFINSDGSFNTTPLPKIMFNILSKNGYINEILKPFTPDYLTAKSYETGIIKTTSNTYTIHHFAASWHGKKEKIYKIFRKCFGEKLAHLCSVIFKKFF